MLASNLFNPNTVWLAVKYVAQTTVLFFCKDTLLLTFNLCIQILWKFFPGKNPNISPDRLIDIFAQVEWFNIYVNNLSAVYANSYKTYSHHVGIISTHTVLYILLWWHTSLDINHNSKTEGLWFNNTKSDKLLLKKRSLSEIKSN